MLRKFVNSEGGNFAVTSALIAVPMFMVGAVGYDHMQFSALSQRLPDAAMQALIPAAQEMIHGTRDLRRLEKIAEDFLSVNLPQEDTNLISLKLSFRKNPQNGHLDGLNIYAEAIYVPVSGFFADIIPARSKTGQPWIAAFGKPDAADENSKQNQ